MKAVVLKVITVLVVLVTAAVLYGLETAGDGAVRVTFSPYNERYPDWSPDGSKLVYQSDRNGNWDIFTIDLTTGVETQVTADTGWDARATWSRDGSLIAFESDRNNDTLNPGYPHCELFVIPPSGEPATQVTNWPWYNERPDWSADNSELVYASDFRLDDDMAADQGLGYAHPANLWRIPVAGGAPVQVTTNPGYENDADWSLDGGTIAFSGDYAGNWDIWTISAGGGGATQVTTDPATDNDPSFSPDGNSIAFWSHRSGNDDIWIAPAGGGTAIQVTTSPYSDWHPSWSPDGTKIAFDSGRGINSVDIWIIDVPTSGVKHNSATWGWIKSLFK